MKTGKDIYQAKLFLEQGELVAIPTETVYGLAANGLDPEAVAKIFEAKNRPSFNPLILHVPDLESMKGLVRLIPPKAYLLAKEFWPGPLTLVLPKTDKVPDIVTAGLDTVAIRIPSHPLTLELLKELDFPLAAPSANVFGYVSPTTPEHVMDQLGNKVAYILDGGTCQVGIESTILKVEDDDIGVLRLGGLELEKIERLVGKTYIKAPVSNPEAPGMLRSHYSPRKKLIVGSIRQNLEKYAGKKIGIISYTKSYHHVDPENLFVLSSAGDLREAARNLFMALRKLDASDVEVILAEYVPDVSLGRAINDRLKRAAAKG